MQTPDEMIGRVNAWLSASGTPIVAAARAAGVAENTAHAVLRGGRGRIETLRRLCSLVPADFHTSSIALEAEQNPNATEDPPSAAEICGEAA